jgi:formyl-CoA transferase
MNGLLDTEKGGKSNRWRGHSTNLRCIILMPAALAYVKRLYSLAPWLQGFLMPFAAKPLSGLKVVELGTLIAGPFASRICAEFGAQVIKVESPDGGDPLRKWRKLYEGTSLWWFVQARNKKSLTLNLKHPMAWRSSRQLLADADILIENFRPGVLEKLGLSWDTLHALNPKLVMVSACRALARPGR